MAISIKVVLHFPRHLMNQPIIYHLARHYDVEFNILKASITPQEEGVLVMELKGEQKDYEGGIKYLTDSGVEVHPLSRNVARDEDKCTHCGVCVAVCPVGALILDPATRRVDFCESKCIACELCIKACPPRAMKVCL